MRSALALALLLLVPVASAHVPHERPHVQSAEAPHTPNITMNGTAAVVTLLDTSEPMRNFVKHVVDPGHMTFSVEHRANPSIAEGAFRARWEMSRLVTYRDVNHDGAYEVGTDTVVRSWRFASYQWKTEGVRSVSVGGQAGALDVLWNGTLGGGPDVTLEMVAAGADVSDEGARAFPQDVLLYLTFPSLPPRDTGTLYALDGDVVTAPGVAFGDQTLGDKLTIDVFADDGSRRAFFDWGGTALLDGREANVTWSMDERGTPVGVNEQRGFRMNLPLFDRSMRLVMVSGIEYPIPTRSYVPDVSAPLAGFAVAALAVALRCGRALGAASRSTSGEGSPAARP